MQPSVLIVDPSPCCSSVHHVQQFIRDVPNTTSTIRVPSSLGWKAESKLYPSSQTHPIQCLRGRVGHIFRKFNFFCSKIKFLHDICSNFVERCTQANTERPHNAEDDGALRQALLDGGYKETAGEMYSTWVKREAAGIKRNAETYSGKLADKPIFTDFAEASKEDQALVGKLNAGRIGTDGTGKAISPNTQSEGTIRADRIAARMGKRVVWVTGLAGDGFSDPTISRDAIFLNPNSQRSVQVLAAHELTHNLAAQYPAQFKDLIDAIRPNLDKSEWAGFVERQRKDSLAATGKLLSPATLRSEMVANLLSDYVYRSHEAAAKSEFTARGGNFTGYGGYPPAHTHIYM